MAMMDKASQLDGSELTPFQVGAVDNDRCTSLQEEKWRNLPFLQNWKPTDCFFDDEAEEDLVAVFDLNYALNWVWFMQYNIFGLLQFSLFVNLVGYPLAMAGDKVVSGAEFDWHDYARWLLGSILPFAQGYFFVILLCLMFPHYRKGALVVFHLMNGCIIGWLPHRPIFRDLRSMHAAVTRDGIKFAKERRSSICFWPFSRQNSGMDPTIITVPFHDIADCQLVSVSANLEPHTEVRLMARLRTDQQDVEKNDSFVWCQIAIPYLMHGEEFQQLIREIIKQQKQFEEKEMEEDCKEKLIPVLNFTELFNHKLQKKVSNGGTETIISWTSWASSSSSLMDRVGSIRSDLTYPLIEK